MTTSTHLRQVAARTAIDGIAEALTEGAATIEQHEATIARRDAVIKLLEGEVTDAHDRNAALVAVLSRARAFIHLDRQSLADCSMRPDNTMETDDAEAVAIYDAMLHEVDAAIAAQAKEGGEPFGYFRAEPFGWTDCAKTDEGAIALYEHPPASLEQSRWCEYVAGMVDHWVRTDEYASIKADEDRCAKAIAGIIERRLWALKRDPAKSKSSSPAKRAATSKG